MASCQPGMSPQSASRGPVGTGVRPCFLCSGNVRAHSGQQLANAVRPMIYVSFLEFQAGSCLYVTTAVKAASHFGKAQGDQSGQKPVLGSLEPVASLVPPPPSLPLSFFAFWVFLNRILRISPLFLWCVPGRLFVAENTFLSFLSLPLPLSFFPSLFPLFSLFLGCPWMLSS